jgi:hypothetical protein
VVLLASAAVLAAAAAEGVSTATRADVPAATATANHTVITESGRAGTITAYAPDGTVLYYDNAQTKYFDVDPVRGEPLVVEYVATDTVHTRGPTCSDPPCVRNVLERVDLETGRVETLYARYAHRERAGEWHDHDRINDTHVVIADIAADQVSVVDTRTERVTWLWDAQAAYPVTGGGPYPADWTHVNDVEYLTAGVHAGRVMVSLRNQDQVVFLDPADGRQDGWTLGADDAHEVLFEQHNPDYVPASRGGPAVVVADSENGRVKEFQRRDGAWVRTWQWADRRLQWPRDADRLPNGHTLVTDTHGNRVLEVDEDGDVVWQVASTLPYDAERLETGVESAGGHSARDLQLASRTAGSGGSRDDGGVLATVADAVETVVPHWLYNGILYVSPPWMDRPAFAAAGVSIGTVLVWAGLETTWWLRRTGLGVRWPVYRREE